MNKSRMKNLILILYVLSLVSTKSLQLDNNANQRWRISVYMPPTDNIESSIDNVYNKESELLQLIHETIARNSPYSRELKLNTKIEKYTKRKQKTIYEERNKNYKTLSRKQLFRRLAQLLKDNKMADNLIRKSLNSLNIDKQYINNTTDKDKDPCSVPGICRTQNGFAQFLHDFISLMLKLEISDFYLFCQILTDIIKFTDFSDALDHATDKCIREYVENFEMAEDRAKKDLIEYSLAVVDKNNDTVTGIISIEHQRRAAWKDLIHLLDDIIPRSDNNINDWNDVKTAMTNFIAGKLSYIEPVLTYLLENLKINLRGLNKYLKAKVLDSFGKVCNSFYHRYVHDDFMLFPIDPELNRRFNDQPIG